MRLRAQFAIQLGGSVLNALAFIILTPVLISYLGIDRYGVLLLILGFLVYAGLAEFGLGAATSREIAAIAGNGRRKIFGTSLLMSGVFAFAGGAIFSLLAIPNVARVFVNNPQVVTELEGSARVLFALGSISILASVPRSVLFGASSFVYLNIVNVFHSLASLLGPAAYAIFFGVDLPGLIGVTALAYGLSGLLAFLFCLMERLRPIFTADGSIIRALVSYGSWATISAVLHRLTASLDRILIGAFLGPSAVTLFVIPQSAIERSQILSSSLMSAAFPRLARNSDNEGLIEACYRGLFLMAPLFVFGVAILFPVLSVWLGRSFANQAHVAAVLLALAIWVDVLARVPYALLQAKSKLKHEANLAAIIVLPNLVMLVLAVKFLGIAGAAAVSIFRSSAYLILRLNKTGLPSHLVPPMVGNSLSVLLAVVASLSYVLGAGIIISASVWLVALTASLFLNYKFGIEAMRNFRFISRVSQ